MFFFLKYFTDKSQPPKHTDLKKPQESVSAQMSPMGAYSSMYPFYPQQQYMVPPDHQGPPKQLQPGNDYNKSKDPPLDLMTKPPQQQNQQQPLDGSVKDSSAGPTQGHHNSGNMLPNPMQPTKPMSHYYPFKYVD